MIAEDESLIAFLLAELLEEMGHCVCASVASAEEAVLAAKAELPELIIMDGTLRQGSGIHAMKEILQVGFIPHIFVTGDPYRFCAEPGAIIVQKPFDAPSLGRAIDRALLPSAF